MRIYFSGVSGSGNPEVVVPERQPHVMLTFHTMETNETRNRLRVYLTRKKNERKSRSISK